MLAAILHTAVVAQQMHMYTYDTSNVYAAYSTCKMYTSHRKKCRIPGYYVFSTPTLDFVVLLQSGDCIFYRQGRGGCRRGGPSPFLGQGQAHVLGWHPGGRCWRWTASSSKVALHDRGVSCGTLRVAPCDWAHNVSVGVPRQVLQRPCESDSAPRSRARERALEVHPGGVLHKRSPPLGRLRRCLHGGPYGPHRGGSCGEDEDP